MANFFGNPIGRSAAVGTTWIANNAWRAIGTPYADRQWIMFQVKSGTALAVQFVNRNADGTFTAPSGNVNPHIIYPANSVVVLPVGDTIQIYGRAAAKSGSTATGGRIAWVEFK